MPATGRAIIIGAGPAGLTAAYELARRAGIRPIVVEMSNRVGGIATTVSHRGNRIDFGGHRFFSKSDRVMEWWLRFLPLQGGAGGSDERIAIAYQRKSRSIPAAADGPDPDTVDRVMLVRHRLSRIYYRRKFFDYPVALSPRTVRNLGLTTVAGIGLSYLWARAFPIAPERNLEDFFINRFGRRLYETFFKDYTEKVWGVPCTEIEPDWGAQRVKGLSLRKVVSHALGRLTRKDRSVAQKGTETSLIERFLYPKYGPGQMWDEVAREVVKAGGEVRKNVRAVGLERSGNRITAVACRNERTGEVANEQADYVVSTMPVKELVRALGAGVPPEVAEVADGLRYRDFLTVGILLRGLKVSGRAGGRSNGLIPDNWIYIQEPDVRVGRLQIFNNWSPYMVADPANVWIGSEYFCNEGDSLWAMPDDDLASLAVEELEKIDIIDRADVLDAVVLRMPKAYPAYFGTYRRFDAVRQYTDQIENLFLVGRNGMHRYNNQDHSMLAAMTAVDNIIDGVTSKDNIWDVNAEQEYHESRKT